MNRDQMIELIGRSAREVLPGLDEHIFGPEDRLQELGANSVDRAEIVMLVQEALSMSVPRVELFGPRNVGQLADLLVGKLRAQ